MSATSMEVRREVLGDENEETLSSMDMVGLARSLGGKYKEAEAMHREALVLLKKVNGPQHPDTLTSMNNLAGVLDRQGKYEEAEAMHRQTLATSEKVLGREHLNTLTTVYCLAYLLARQCCYDESLVLYNRACAGYNNVLGKNHPTTRACCQHRLEAVASKEQTEVVFSLAAPDKGVSTPTGNVSGLSRGLAKLGIGSSKHRRG